MLNGSIFEPYQVDTTLVTGFSVKVSKYLVEIIGLHTFSDIGSGEDEHRVVARLALPIDVAAELRDTLDAMLASERSTRAAAAPSQQLLHA